jgi:NH3-dependent NAD+ synthetase
LAIQRYEETSAELKRIQEACSAMEVARDEISVSNMVSSAISAGVFKALEQERDEAISSLNLQFKAILKRMQGEFRSSRER